MLIKDETPDMIMTYTGSKHEVIPESVGQFTGLTDKNGTKIFEGDIISSYSPCIDESLPWKPETLYRVGWHESGCWNLFKTMSDEHNGITGICLSNLQWYTVVGNIYDNPDLLK